MTLPGLSAEGRFIYTGHQVTQVNRRAERRTGLTVSVVNVKHYIDSSLLPYVVLQYYRELEPTPALNHTAKQNLAFLKLPLEKKPHTNDNPLKQQKYSSGFID